MVPVTIIRYASVAFGRLEIPFTYSTLAYFLETFPLPSSAASYDQSDWISVISKVEPLHSESYGSNLAFSHLLQSVTIANFKFQKPIFWVLCEQLF